MIVPMKKATLIVLDSEKKQALRTLRRFGLMHIEITEGRGDRLLRLREDTELLQRAIMLVADYSTEEGTPKSADTQQSLDIAAETTRLVEQKSALNIEQKQLEAELGRYSSWGDIVPSDIDELAAQGVKLTLCEMSAAEYRMLGEDVTTVVLQRTKSAVRFAVVGELPAPDSPDAFVSRCRVTLPEVSTEELRDRLSTAEQSITDINSRLEECFLYSDSMKAAVAALGQDARFETYATGMDVQSLSDGGDHSVSIACLVGYFPAENAEQLTALAADNSWGLMLSDPTSEDNAPTKLHNNRFVSLIYPLTDFLGTVPGYFEYDISAWFLGFILVFFGIIFGDGGYGLLICAVSLVLIIRSYVTKKTVPPAFWLFLLMGGATVLWGILTCTWFGLSPELLPTWMQKISIPFISNVYADHPWYLPWCSGDAYLTTSQNVQIVCFTMALVQLSVAHIMSAMRNRRSLKCLGDLGSVLQLLGIYYVVLSLVVNSKVFGLGLVVGGVPVGTCAILCVGVGFLLSFVLSNYEGSIGASVVTSLKNIVSVLLGVINVFSDIVSYIRLWAVGLAGAAISATVNELVSPMLGNLMMMVFAIILLVFGHGLNMILNVLSVIVHGVRLNTLEFSTHLDMSWGGHKYDPFGE